MTRTNELSGDSHPSDGYLLTITNEVIDGIREYAQVVRSGAFFEDGEDYEPAHPLACVVGEPSAGGQIVRSKIMAGEYPEALRLAADMRRKGNRSRDLAVRHVTAWSLINWLPLGDGIKSNEPDDALANLTLSRQAIAEGKGDEAARWTDLLSARFPEVPSIRSLRRMAEAVREPHAAGLRSLRDEIEKAGDWSLHYSLAMIERRLDPAAGLSRLQTCVKERPYVPGYIARLMYELMSERRFEEALQSYEENGEFASKCYVPRRMALLTRTALEGPDAALDQIWEMHRKERYDKLLPLNLISILRHRGAYLKALRVWIGWYPAFLRAWPDGDA